MSRAITLLRISIFYEVPHCLPLTQETFVPFNVCQLWSTLPSSSAQPLLSPVHRLPCTVQRAESSKKHCARPLVLKYGKQHHLTTSFQSFSTAGKLGTHQAVLNSLLGLDRLDGLFELFSLSEALAPLSGTSCTT